MGRSDVSQLARVARLGEVFTRREAIAAGITLRQLRGPAIRPVYRGVFTLAADANALDVRVRAALKVAGPQALPCQTTALALLGVELPHPRLTNTVHLWVPPYSVAPQVPGVRVHQNSLTRVARQTSSGLWLVHPADAWFQAARSLSVRDLVVLADGLMRRREPILAPEVLPSVVAKNPGQRGVVKARAALELARPRTDSPKETETRLNLIEGGLPCPVVNHPFRRRDGSILYWLDMAYPEVKLAVEYDGGGHGEIVQMRKDRTRRRIIEDAGWRIITATAVDLDNPRPLVASIHQALAARRFQA